MAPKLWKFYLRTTLIPACVSLLVLFIYLIYDRHWGIGAHFKSEWMTADSLDELVLLLACINALLFALAALSLFLNTRASVRQNPGLSFLAWFLLPVGYLLVIALKAADDDTETIMTLLCVTLPYLVALVFTFIRFRRKLKQLTVPETISADR